MIGVFDSGVGGLTVLRSLVARFPDQDFLYLGDHAHVPYGNRSSHEIVDLTRRAVEHLFEDGCKLVLLGCNTATAVAARWLQQQWLPHTDWRARGHNVLGIIAPTVEVATQTPWAVTTPQYPQKFNSDTIVVFGTQTTISSGVFREEIGKRCPRVTVVQTACPELAGAIEDRAGQAVCESLVRTACRAAIDACGGKAVDSAILGCTHFPLVEELFQRYMPVGTRILSQPGAVADSLEDYLQRRPEFRDASHQNGQVRLMTTGRPAIVGEMAQIFWPDAPAFELRVYAPAHTAI